MVWLLKPKAPFQLLYSCSTCFILVSAGFFTAQKEVYSLLTKKGKERKTETCNLYPWGSGNYKRASHLSGAILVHWMKSTFHMSNC